MGTGGKCTIRKVGASCAAAVLAVALFSFPAFCADYPRRVAVGPFVPLAADNIAQTVSVLPRLLSSRLMALAGAEVVLLTPGEKPPAEQAKEAGMPLLVQGTVAKLGKGYSIDVAVLDIGTGKTAGAFFASANGEDEIIPQIGFLAGEIAERLFGVKPAFRPVQAPSQAPVAPPSGTGVPPASVPVAAASAQPPAASPVDLRGGWVPSSFSKISESGKVLDELYGVAALAADPEGNGEIVAYGKRTLYFYRVAGRNLTLVARVDRGVLQHILDAGAVDVDGDGKNELVVSCMDEEALKSFVLKKKGEAYEEIAGGIPYHLVVLPDWMGKKAVVGQAAGIDAPFYGKFLLMSWDGKTVKPGQPLTVNTSILPLSGGIYGLSSAKFGNEWTLIYTDEGDRLRLVDSDGKSQYKSKETFGPAADAFEFGPIVPLEGRRRQLPLRKGARTVPGVEEKPMVLVTAAKKGILGTGLGASIESSRLVLLQWDGSEFVEKIATPKSDHIRTGADILAASDLRKGSRVVVSSIEQPGGVLQKEMSRVLLFELE